MRESCHLNKDSDCSRHGNAIGVLMEIARTLASPLELQEILENILSQVSRLLNPKACSLLLRDEESGELEFAAVVSEVAGKLKGVKLARGQGVAGRVAENGESLIIPDVSRDPGFADEFDRSFSFTIHSLACIPIKCHDQIFGVIELVNSLEEGSFSEADEQILITIADFAGIAIANARAVARINRLVITDDLTGLYNSRYFFEQVEYEVERAKRYYTPLSLVFFDLDRFKTVNDTYGHLTGSRLLQEVGELVQKLIRKTDRAARYGGDEFVIILPHTEKSGARMLAFKIMEALNQQNFLSNCGKPLVVTASFGVSACPDDAQTSAELINAADKAMYLVKESGRNDINVADGSGSFNVIIR